jgi:site-specific DNA-methyltransferase (adenine-specific)
MQEYVNRIICGDNVEVLSHFDDESIDLTVTSPPYDNLRGYEEYNYNFRCVADALYRVTKKGGVVVWVVGDATINGSETGTSFRQALYFKEIRFSIHDTMIYEKAQACFGSKNCYLPSFEYMFVFSKGKPKTVNLIKDRENVRSGVESMAAAGLSVDGKKAVRVRKDMKPFGKRKNIWKYGVGGGHKKHPAVFPERLAMDHILSWSNDGDLVLDPFVGSGTTCRAAKLNGRRFIGIDIADVYCEMAEQAIDGIMIQ